MYILLIVAKVKRLLSFGFLKVLYWVLILDVFFGTCFYFAERSAQDISYLDSLWWAMVTMTTVGYGDFYAQTTVGRFLISYPCMIVGIGLIGYLVGVVANSMIDWASRKRRGGVKMRLKGHIVICNYPGEDKILNIVEELRMAPKYKTCKFVLVADVLDEIPDRLSKANVSYVKGLPTDQETLMRANILECAGVLVLSEDAAERRSDDRTYAVSSIVEMIQGDSNIDIKTIAEVVASQSLRNLEQANVDGMVASEGLTSCLMVQEFLNPGVHKIISQLISNAVGSQLYLHETRLAGCRIVDIQKAVLEHDANIQIIGLVQKGKYVLNPSKKITILKGDRLIVLAENLCDLGGIESEIIAKSGQAVPVG